MPASAYDALCDELTELAREITDSRTGQPLAARVLRTRVRPEESGPALPPADLIVCWRDDVVTDAVDHPRLGRVGPVPHFAAAGIPPKGSVCWQAKVSPLASGSMSVRRRISPLRCWRGWVCRTRPMSAGVPSPTPLTLKAPEQVACTHLFGVIGFWRPTATTTRLCTDPQSRGGITAAPASFHHRPVVGGATASHVRPGQCFVPTPRPVPIMRRHVPYMSHPPLPYRRCGAGWGHAPRCLRVVQGYARHPHASRPRRH